MSKKPETVELFSLSPFKYSFVSLPVQDIDGQALLLLTLPTVQECMDLKLGPAIKLCHQIERVKVAFYRQYANWSRSSNSKSPTEHSVRKRRRGPARLGHVGLGASWWKTLAVLAMWSFCGFPACETRGICLGAVALEKHKLSYNGSKFPYEKLKDSFLGYCRCENVTQYPEKLPHCWLKTQQHTGVDPCAFTDLWRRFFFLRSWGLVFPKTFVFISCFSFPFSLW